MQIPGEFQLKIHAERLEKVNNFLQRYSIKRTVKIAL